MSTATRPRRRTGSGTGAGSSSSRYKDELGDLVRQYPKKRSLYIDYRDVYAFGKPGVRMAQELIENPGKVLEDVRDAVQAQQLARGKGAKDPEVNIRFTNLPVRLGARDIRSEHINRFVSVEGILRKTTEVRPRIVEAVFRCPGGHLTRKAQEFGMFVEPDGCATEGCTYRKLTLVPKRSSFVDAQKLRIQESPEGLRGGEQPQTIDVDVTDDITGTVAPGDRVVINGILRSQQRVNHGNKSTFFDIHLEANSIEVGEKEFEEVSISDKDEEEIQRLSNDPEVYRKIMRSIAPTIYGNEEVKEAIALQLFGGIMKSMPDGSHLRGDIHCLLIGDPGIAKSQILRYVVRLSPRGIYTSGQSSTQAGLTATAVKDEFGDGRWTLEAGALVLADMGIAAVDEMDKMQKDDRSALHEAMEQQAGHCVEVPNHVVTSGGTASPSGRQLDLGGQSRDHGHAEVALRPARRGEPEARPVRRVRGHRRADQHAAVAPQPLRPDLHPGRQARPQARRGDRRAHPQGARGRGADRPAREGPDRGGRRRVHPARARARDPRDRAGHAPEVRRVREADLLPDPLARGQGRARRVLHAPARPRRLEQARAGHGPAGSRPSSGWPRPRPGSGSRRGSRRTTPSGSSGSSTPASGRSRTTPRPGPSTSTRSRPGSRRASAT